MAGIGLVALVALLWQAGVFTAGGPAPAVGVPVAERPMAGAPAAAPAVPAGEAVPAPVPIPPSFDVVRVEPGGSTVLAGRAAPGAEVSILDGETLLGSVTADSRGEWVLLPDAPLAPGGRDLRLEAVNPNGLVVAGAGTVTLVVPEPQRDIAGRAQADTGDALALLTPPAGATRVLQAPAGEPDPGAPAAPAADLPVQVEALDYDRQGRVTIGGRATPGTEVMVYLDNALLGRARADDQGYWSVRPDRPLAEGSYSLRADAVRADGNVAARAEVAFDKRGFPEDLLASRAVVVLPGNNLWAIARRSYGEGPRYTQIFQANQTQIRDPDLIYPGQIFLLPEQRVVR